MIVVGLEFRVAGGRFRVKGRADQIVGFDGY